METAKEIARVKMVKDGQEARDFSLLLCECLVRPGCFYTPAWGINQSSIPGAPEIEILELGQEPKRGQAQGQAQGPVPNA